MKRLIISLLSLVGLCVSCSDNDVDGVSFDSSVVKPAELRTCAIKYPATL